MGIKPPYHCGASWWPTWLQKFLSQRFNDCCREHDEAYRDGPRGVADNMFRKCIFCQAWPFFRWEVIALIYGAAVTLFGWLFKKPRQWPWKRL